MTTERTLAVLPTGPADGEARAARRRVAAAHKKSRLHISALRGIDQETRSKLRRHGIIYADQLLAATGSALTRRTLAAALRVSESALWQLASRADLARISGIGTMFAEILRASGFERVDALATVDPIVLQAQLAETNARERLAQRAPTAQEVASWVNQARALPTLLES
jgi:predicted flap endonuclease-1-like 5' DNA nuclease